MAILLTLAMVGCGGGGGETATPATSTSSTSAPPTPTTMTVPIEVGLETSDANSSHGASLAVGDTLEIRMETEPVSGYSWLVTKGPDRSVLKGSGKSVMTPESPAPGVISQQVFTYKAVGKGWASIEISYVNGPGGKPKRVSTFRIQVY